MINDRVATAKQPFHGHWSYAALSRNFLSFFFFVVRAPQIKIQKKGTYAPVQQEKRKREVPWHTVWCERKRAVVWPVSSLFLIHSLWNGQTTSRYAPLTHRVLKEHILSNAQILETETTSEKRQENKGLTGLSLIIWADRIMFFYFFLFNFSHHQQLNLWLTISWWPLASCWWWRN